MSFVAGSTLKALHLSRTVLDTSAQTCGNFAPQAAVSVPGEQTFMSVFDIIVLMVLPRETNNNSMPLLSFPLQFMCVHRPFAFFCDASRCPPLISPPFFTSSQGKNVVAMEKIKTSVVTTINEAFFNPTIKLNLLQIHHHHPTQQNILQRSPHDNMKMAAVHASMSTRGCDEKEIATLMLLSPDELAPKGFRCDLGAAVRLFVLTAPTWRPC